MSDCTFTGGDEPCPTCPRRVTALHMCKLLQDVAAGSPPEPVQQPAPEQPVAWADRLSLALHMTGPDELILQMAEFVIAKSAHPAPAQQPPHERAEVEVVAWLWKYPSGATSLNYRKPRGNGRGGKMPTARPLTYADAPQRPAAEEAIAALKRAEFCLTEYVVNCHGRAEYALTEIATALAALKSHETGAGDEKGKGQA